MPRMKLQGLQPRIETRAFDDLLAESIQQRDVTARRQLLLLTSTWTVPRGPRTYDILCRDLADDAIALRALYEETMSDKTTEHAAAGIPEAAGISIFGHAPPAVTRTLRCSSSRRCSLS